MAQKALFEELCHRFRILMEYLGLGGDSGIFGAYEMNQF